MSNVKSDIYAAQRILESNTYNNDSFKRIYPFATENVPGCLSFYDFNGKDCISVLGSSSQLLYMYLNGAKSVTSFDINNLSIHYFYFLKAFISSELNKKYLFQLFSSKDNNEDIFNEISNHLEGDSSIFWKTLFEKYGSGLFNEFKLFNYFESKKPYMYDTAGYLSDIGLKKLRKIVDKIEPNFINCNIKDLDGKLDDEFDLMYLSNIIQYVDDKALYGYSEEMEKPLLKYKELLKNLRSHLKKDGLLLGGYIYNIEDSNSDIPIFDKTTREKVFGVDEFDYHLFDSFTSFQVNKWDSYKDACLIYKR